MASTHVAPTIDRDAIRRKYAAERDKRLRADGSAQYRRLECEFSDLATDPYNPVVPREPVTDHVTFAFIGGGFGGLVVGARLKEAGIENYRIIEKGGDFGGTWYWNRYPGAQCDTASMIYMPLLEETGHMPSEKYAHAPEIRDHCSRIGEHYGLYENALFHTRVTDLEWDDAKKVWLIRTDPLPRSRSFNKFFKPLTRFSPRLSMVARMTSGLVRTKFVGDSALMNCRV